ncbi:putative ribophorin I [Rosellinia necatrix]|uniref:Dolichyl-diphosphooligosaccharide--protein glycosyltransferase subunit 1 n=1 Tax=Rosellinia necatrix TaxID=77044 RepID=A0A1W2TGU4_ROSNE|nr:putative ribophorin I [Rosellinia necatrix]
MKFAATAAACLSLLSTVAGSASSKVILPSTFQPPQTFKNANLVHIISLEKNYVKESINVLIENVSPDPQDEYFVPFTSDQMKKLGGIEVKDRKNPDVVGFTVAAVAFDPSSATQFYQIKLPVPLPSKSQQTLGISFYYLNTLKALPASIEQADKQYLVHTFSAYCPSAYPTLKQKTEVKLPSADAPDYTKIAGHGETKEFPIKQGSKLTYGPFPEVAAGAISPVKVRYEFNKPVTHVSQLERDIEVSHWGGNVAFEERYALFHYGANLSSQFSRVKWAQSQYFSPQTFALKEMKFILGAGTKDAYFTDVIGNVSTSRFRSNKREAVLELKPRYPIFGGWKYPFTVGWNADSSNYLKKSGGQFLLNVPLIEGPKQAEGVEYEHVDIRVILPEGAENVKFYTTAPESSITEHSVGIVKTYLDTIGRTVLTVQARNLVDEFRDRELVVSYEYSTAAALRKPFVIFSSTIAVFVGMWLLSKLDVSFSTK